MTPNFSIKSLNKDTVGQKLLKAREAKGLSIPNIEDAIKIRAKYIKALEEGDYKKLPPEVYIQGFLKNYADFLGLGRGKIMREYLLERGLSGVKKQAVNESLKKASKGPKFVITPRTLILAFISISVFLVVIYIGWQVKILTAPPKLELKTPSENISIDSDSINVEGKADAGADIYVNDVLVGGGPEGDFKEKISLQNGLNVITVKAKNRMGKQSEIVREVAVNLKPVLAAVEAPQGVELKVNVGPNSALINVVVDGVPVEKDGIVMLSGSSRVFQGKDKVVITSKNAGSTNITFNGKDIGPLGKEGETVKNREFTKDMQVK